MLRKRLISSHMLSPIWLFGLCAVLSQTVQSEGNYNDIWNAILSATTIRTTKLQTDLQPTEYEYVPSHEERDTPTSNCKCVPYHMCKENQTEAGQSFIDLRVATDLRTNHNTMSDPCGSFNFNVCCKPEYISNTFIPTESTSLPTEAKWKTCGHRNINGVGFHHASEASNKVSKFGEFPWTVAVLTNANNKITYLCGGSLIHPRVVLTAAHNVKGQQSLSVRVGEWDTQRDKEPLSAQSRRVDKIVIHEEFNKNSAYNDIALLILESPVDLAPNVATICLPEQGENMDHRDCTASGWGKDAFGKEGFFQAIMKKLDLPIVPRNSCQAALRKTRLTPNFKLHSSFICAGGEVNKDTCEGDGGSPLVCPKKDSPGTYVQAGIVSWGIGCNSEAPGVYVDVSQFRNWIDDKLSFYRLA